MIIIFRLSWGETRGSAIEHALTANRDDVVWLKRGPTTRRGGANEKLAQRYGARRLR